MNDDDFMDRTLHALANAQRRRMLDVIKAEPGVSVGDIAEHFAMSRIGVMGHLRVLREADLVVSNKEGRTRRHYLNAVPIQQIHERWSSEFSALWAAQMTAFKRDVERTASEAATPTGAGT